MRDKRLRLFLALSAIISPAFLAGCSSSSVSPPPPIAPAAMGNVITSVGDASTEDWATIGVRVLGISLMPQGGGAAVPIYTAPSPAPYVNLVELDQLSEIIGNASIPAGTYTGAKISISANPGDVLLTAAADPSAGFAGTAGATVPSGQIEVQGANGSAGSMSVSFNVNLVSPLVVTANQTNALDLEFDLSHPAFLVAHVPVGGGTTLWAVNFRGPIRHRPHASLDHFLLRDHYATVLSVASNNLSLSADKDFPVYPPTNPETAIQTSVALNFQIDATDGTIFYDVDGKTSAVIKDLSSVASTLPGKFIRVTTRFQNDGTLVAVRMWASGSFNKLWLNPEGHVLHVNTNTNVVTVENELGFAIPVTVDANTQFFYRVPASALADATPIGVGPSFLANKDLVRGFKVHLSVDDPLASPLVAQTIDIENARYAGTISAANTTNFVYTNTFHTSTDDYSKTLPYLSSSSPNASNPAAGTMVTGFIWWNFTFPTLVDTGMSAIPDFVSATNGSANFGGTVGSLSASGVSRTTWADPSNPTGWSAIYAILQPTTAPLGTVTVPWVTSANGGSFSMGITGGTNSVAVDLSSTPQSATLVYQVDRTGGIVTISPIDITTANGLAAVAANVVNGTTVKVSGVPQADGSIKAYVLFYYTGVKPAAGS